MSPVRGQTKWFLRKLPVDQRKHPLKVSPNRGRPVLDGWVSRQGRWFPLPLELTFCVTFFLWENTNLARETSSSGLTKKGDSPPQRPPTAVSCSGSSSEGRISAEYDSLLMMSARSRLHAGLWRTTEMGAGMSSMPSGNCPEGNVKKYGKGVLVRAKDITQARMLQHLPCPSDSMFETVKAHETFNYSKGGVYSQDLYEFPEEEILAMCPSSVQKVRCRQCPRYRLEQDILQLANSQFISLGSAHRDLLYSQKDGTGATSYASLAARSSAESAGSRTTTSRSVGAGGPVHLASRFALLSDDSVESSLSNDENNTDLTNVTHVMDVHLPPVSPKPLRGLTKQHRGSAESIDLA
ncbi:hypothetical protein E2C01_051713 [Portunus trituberculatus]|uniref:Uncharacterized protein n=1 Tax=Portunus trituberculatus TaxID=210409 RepID=A0A5B7GKB5_PORTR|nr:hypothetical protein [Portunus trituberculatus]